MDLFEGTFALDRCRIAREPDGTFHKKEIKAKGSAPLDALAVFIVRL
jgi:hypothetical protein